MPERADAPEVRIQPWSEADFGLLALQNTPEMTALLGGPEPEQKLHERHRRYLAVGESGKGRMFTVVLLPTLETVGSVGYWERSWQGATVYETGWAVLPAYQGLGLATVAARQAVVAARAEHTHRYLHAFPSTDHPASNAVCRKAGFSLLGEVDFEYPPGCVKPSNDWRLDLAEA